MAGTIAAPDNSRARAPSPTKGPSFDVEAPPAPVLGAPAGTTEALAADNVGVTAAETAETAEVKNPLVAVTVKV